MDRLTFVSPITISGGAVTIRGVDTVVTIEVRGVGQPRAPRVSIAVPHAGLVIKPSFDGALEPGRSAPRYSFRNGASLATGPSSPVQIEVPVSIDAPGVYSLMVITDLEPPKDSLGASVVAREVWVQADADGLRILDGFDPGSLPPGIVPRAGRYESRPSRPVAGGSAAGGPQLGVTWTETTGALVYLNDTTQALGAPGVEIHLDVWDNYESKYVASSGYGATQAGGAFTIDCPPSSFERYDYTFRLNGVYADLASPYNQATAMSLYYGSSGGDMGNVVVNTSAAARLFVAYNSYIVPTSQAYFNQTRGQMVVRYSPLDSSSYYSSGDDEIRIFAASVWGNHGRFAQSHEYGHALHEQALGGLAPVDETCEEHEVGTPETYGCAYDEGFGDFHAIMVYGVFSQQFFESHTYYQNPPYGENTEGAVVGLLWDLVDSASWPNSTSEAWDNAAYPGSYIAQLIKTCSVLTTRWEHGSGIDHFVYCAEQQVDTAVSNNYFQLRNAAPIAETESATEPTGSPPGGWSLAAVRAAWLWNLYGEN